jgi:hypothetical protein
LFGQPAKEGFDVLLVDRQSEIAVEMLSVELFYECDVALVLLLLFVLETTRASIKASAAEAAAAAALMREVVCRRNVSGVCV